MIGGLDIYIRNSIIYKNVEDNEYVSNHLLLHIARKKISITFAAD